jgi:hypothetical protein
MKDHERFEDLRRVWALQGSESVRGLDLSPGRRLDRDDVVAPCHASATDAEVRVST